MQNFTWANISLVLGFVCGAAVLLALICAISAVCATLLYERVDNPKKSKFY